MGRKRRTRKERGKLPLKILEAQLVIPKLGFKQPAVPRKYVLFNAAADMTVVGFDHAHSGVQARRNYYIHYSQDFSGEPLPDITAIEESAFHPSFRRKIRIGMHHRDIPKAISSPPP